MGSSRGRTLAFVWAIREVLAGPLCVTVCITVCITCTMRVIAGMNGVSAWVWSSGMHNGADGWCLQMGLMGGVCRWG